MTAAGDGPAPGILVLGIGNILWADEGFGVRCAEAFARRFILPDHVTVMDGGTQGLNLVSPISAASHVLVFDAVDYGAEPASLVTVRGEAVPSFIAAGKMSLHQAGFEDVLACCTLIGARPTDLALVGVQPVELDDYGGSLTPPVRARIDEAIAIAAGILAEWGAVLTRRDGAFEDDHPHFIREIDIDSYERNRPDATIACRTGDDRFFPRSAAA